MINKNLIYKTILSILILYRKDFIRGLSVYVYFTIKKDALDFFIIDDIPYSVSLFNKR